MGQLKKSCERVSFMVEGLGEQAKYLWNYSHSNGHYNAFTKTTGAHGARVEFALTSE